MTLIRNRILRCWGWAAALLTLLGFAATCLAEDAPQITGVRLGFDGKYKVGDWAPIWISLQAGADAAQGSLELTALDGDGVEATYADEKAPPVVLRPGAENTSLRYLKFGRVRSELIVRLRGAGGILAERVFGPGEFPQPLPASHELIVSLGGDASLADAARQMRTRPGEEVVPVALAGAADMPLDWRGYDGVDTLILLTGDGKFLDELDAPRRQALVQWVRLGGRIVLSVGAAGERVFGAQGLLAELSPGRFVGVDTLRRTGGLENFVNSRELLDARAGELKMTLLADVHGKIEIADAAGPSRHAIIAQYPAGFGRATLLTLDLDREPVASWRERGKLVRRLLETSAGKTDRAEHTAAVGRMSHIGYEDLAGQLRAALDSFPGITLVAFSWIAALIVLYVVLIGPVDYFFLRRFAGKMERTWFTFPAIVISFCLFSWLGVRYLRVDRLLVNRVEVVDVDAETGLTRGATWAHLYSPDTERFDLALRPRPAIHPAAGDSGSILTWQGLPGKGLGGMNSTAGKLYNAPYRIVTERVDDALQIEPQGMPIQIRSTRSLVGRWWATAQIEKAGRLAASTDGVLNGEIVNPLTLPLRDCTLAYNHWSYRVPQELAPGAAARFQRRLPDGNLVWRLTQKYVGDDYKEFSTPWDEASRDVPRIVEMLMWHEAAGGRNYTNLLHRYQEDVDLSSHLRMGRAVLIGRIEQPASELTLDGQTPNAEGDRLWTWYRIVYPVTME